jgi:putative oxidoreductase
MTTNSATLSANPSNVWTVADWILRILLGVAFIAAGAAKLAGAPSMVAIFDQIGVGQWFRFVTGGLEVISGVLVLVPRVSVWGALLLASVMTGAVITHLTVIGGNPAPALFLLALTGAVLWLRRGRLAAVVKRNDR